ncbi:PhoH family protein [Ferrovum myxofaciens]|uniref:PhoH-like protein n=2 Tax=Ferrovum myxofaciens TaxID=416213 RepID=A0A149VXL8_9PROT|nr:PhoH family protein [Ferrovum myxofaciens]KXW57970.1 PhoH-like protein [Ferrovum myxofaciens]QKE40851.1 MAG: PhoH family protein [Ferrovum myxofaciens]
MPAPVPEQCEFIPTPLDNVRLSNLCGVLDENLALMARHLDIGLHRRGDVFTLTGLPQDLERARAVLDTLYQEATVPLDPALLFRKLTHLRLQQAEEPALAPTKQILQTRRGQVEARSPRQIQYLQQMREHILCFGVGPAGTGKTYLAVAAAVDALEREEVKRIILVRPAVEAGERLGFLPGDLHQKIDPYLRPLYDALYDLLGHERVGRLFERGVIEVAPLAYMRGRTLNHSFIILDEAQNTTPKQMKMFLTRIGFGTRAVITGDVTQIDLHRTQKSGLIDARNVLQRVEGVAFTIFQTEDVVRHPLVQRIVNAYETQNSSHG